MIVGLAYIAVFYLAGEKIPVMKDLDQYNLMVGIGFTAWRRTRSLDDYILGGRSLGSFVTAMSAVP